MTALPTPDTPGTPGPPNPGDILARVLLAGLVVLGLAAVAVWWFLLAGR